MAANLAAFGTNPISTSGNVTAGNLLTSGSGGAFSGTGNITAGNILTGGLISATGNVTGNYFIGNGSQLTGIASSYGNADVAANLAAFGSNPISTTGNVTAGNIIGTHVGNVTGTTVSVTGNITSGNLLTSGFISATGNITGNNAIFTGNLSVAGNVTYIDSNVVTINDVAINLGNNAANITQVNNGGIELGPQGSPYVTFLYNSSANTFTSNVGLSAVANITGGNLNATGLSLSGNVVSALNSTANITTTANVSVGYILGDGSQLTGIVSSYGNANVAANLAAFGSNPISTSGNVTGNYFIGNGSQLTGIASSYGNADVAANLAAFGSNPISTTGNITAGNILGGANVNATTHTGGTVSVTGDITGGNLYTAGAISSTGNSFGGNLSTTGQVISTNTGSTTTGAGQVYLNGAVNNRIDFNTNGTAAPAFTTRSTGTKIVLYPNIGVAAADYALGVESGALWSGVPDSTNSFKWYGGTTQVGSLSGTGVLSIAGNITGANLNATGLSLSGNVVSVLVSAANITTTANIAGGYILGDGSQLTGIVSTYGNANVAANLAAFGSNPISTSGNITGGNIIGIVAAGANAITTTGNITGGNVNATGLSLSGNVVSALVSAADITTTANITGGYILGNGSQLTGIASTYGNANVAANLAAFGSNPISTSGNITGGNVNASGLSLSGNVVSALNLTLAITTTANITGGNILGGANVNATTHTGDTVSVTGNITGGNVITNTIVGTVTTIKSTGALNLSATGNIEVNSTYISNLLDPVQNQDAATKYYVDSVAQGLHIHDSANLASTADLATYTGATVTYNNGASGVGATLSLVGNTLTTLDGTAIPGSASTRLLIKNQANAVQNGMYNYTSSSLLTRSADFDTSSEAAGGDFLFVTTGATLADTGWVQTTDNPTLGTSPIVFTQFSGAGTFTANTAAGLVLNGTVFSAKTDNISTTFDGTGNIVVKAGAQLTTPNIGAATGTSLSVTGNITGGNIVGLVDAGSNVIITTGNITGGNILGGANVNATTHTGATVSVTGNIITGGGIVSRVVSIADAASVTINADTTDLATQTNTQVAGTLTVNAPTGTLANGQKLMFRLQSSNVQTFAWNAVFAGSTDLSLPTTSSGSSKYDYVGFIYNSTATKWQLLAKNFGF